MFEVQDTRSQFLNSRQAGLEDSIALDIDIRGLLTMLWRRKIIVIGAMLIGISLAFIAIHFIKPVYTARSLVLIETNAGAKFSKEFSSLFTNLKFDSSIILSEIQILKSRTLARKVILKNNLMVDPDLNPDFHADYSKKASEKNAQHFKKLSLYNDELISLPKGALDAQLDFVVSRFLERLSVRAISGSSAVQIEYRSSHPSQAAVMANIVADAYIEQRLETKFLTTKKLTDWLNKRLSTLREQARVADSAIEEYKAKNNILEGTRDIVSVEEISQLNQQLVNARAQKAQAEAKLEQIKAVSSDISKIETIPEVFNSDLVEKLRLQEGDRERQLSELSTRYGLKHPSIITVKSELRSTRKQLRAEILKASESVQNRIKLAQAQVETLETNLEKSSGDSFDDGAAMIRLRELQRDSEAIRLTLDTFLKAYKKSDQQQELQEPEAKIISYAATPNHPSYPNKLLIMSLSAAVSLFMGLAIAILLEKLDNTYRSANQLENTFPFSCFGLIPSIDEKLSDKEIAKYVISKPSSTAAESVKSLRTALNLRNFEKDKKTKILTITSSFPGEGKTTLSIWMGRLAAKSGEKVILIDADLRRPNVHRYVGQTAEGTLADYLTGQKELNAVITKDEASGLHMILGASVPNSALDLVGSAKMKALIESLRQVYDFVIIDSPACLAVSDSRVLASLSDATLYAVSWDETPREVVMGGIKQFMDIGYHNLAFVLTNVDVRKHANYGYGDTVYYYGRYQEYYSS